MNITELKKEVDALSPAELGELSAYIAQKDAEIDRDFSKGGRFKKILELRGKIAKEGDLDQMRAPSIMMAFSDAKTLPIEVQRQRR
ncbi:MAG: hypothetical protein QM796_10555 [Chthoniobacteraceae bacterium]